MSALFRAETGTHALATGQESTAMGTHALATGQESTAMGTHVLARESGKSDPIAYLQVSSRFVGLTLQACCMRSS